MKLIKTALLDDEIANIEILKRILQDCENVEVVWTANNLLDAQKNIEEQPVDVIFMDVQIPPYNSFELIEKISNVNFEVIFVTAYEEYALQALKMAAVDYILKPYKATDIIQAIDKVRAKQDKVRSKQNQQGEVTALLKNYLNNTPRNFSKIVVHVPDGYDIVDLSNIIYIEALDSYSKLKLINNTSYVATRSLKDFEALLSEKGFCRIHKSYLVNMKHIVKIMKGLAASVMMTNGTQIPVSSRKKDVFYEELKGVISF